MRPMKSFPAITSRNNPRTRLFLLGALLVLWGGAICLRLVYLQVIRHSALVQYAARQQRRTIEVSPQRGIIYDRNGQELAMSVLVESVYAVPSQVPDQATTASILAGVLGMEARDIEARMKAQRHFAWIARKVDAETADRIRSLNLRGIGFQKEPKRFYPKRELAAQAIGYVGLDDEGLAGIELAFNDQLKGNPGAMIISQDARRRWFGRIERQPDPGANVVLTIDEKIQYVVEKEIEQAIQETQAKAATIVVQNPYTGEILALANRPTFNPNLSRKITPLSLKNHAVSDVYEPGSVFKTVTYSSALEEKLTRIEEVISCDPGFIVVGGIRIRDSHHIGTVTVERAYAESSDVGAVKMALRLGQDRFYQHIRSFGFGQPTGIELPGETRGLLKPLKAWSGSSIGAMSIGQEIGVTPLQIVSMVSSIANDGLYSPPRIVGGLTQPGRGFEPIAYRPKEQRRVLSPLTAAHMRRLMEGVVLTGTARRAQLNGYTTGGKTGTAQKVDPNTHRYSPTDYVASFVGFAPVSKPAISIAVILDSPRGLHQGGQVSAPVFKRVAEQVLAYMNVPHDADYRRDPRLALMARQTEVNEDVVNRVGDLNMQETPAEAAPVREATVAGRKPAPQLVAETRLSPAANAPAPATPVASTPAPPAAANASPPGVTVAIGDGLPVPDFSGRSLRAAILLAQQSGLELSAVGSGVARAQTPAAGTRVLARSKVIVHFSR